jgi:uncharacterized protein (DUF697 family)
MGTLTDLFELVRDTSYNEIEEEASREVIIALGGNSLEVRDKLNRALNTRLESLWTTSPFRLVDTNERPKSDVEEEGGLFIYALYSGEHIPQAKSAWLKELAASPTVAVIVVVLPREESSSSRERSVSSRLQVVNPLRLIGGGTGSERPSGAAGADGAAFNNAAMQIKAGWEAELEQLEQEANKKLTVVKLKGLELRELQLELLPRIVKGLPERELALARRAPVFRNTVAAYLVNNSARQNAQNILLANATAGLPLVSGLFGGEGTDFLLLTRSQFRLSSQLASVYGQKRDSRVEIFLELLPVVAMAFVWRNVSRRATDKMPRIAQILPKAALAYAATWATGKVAQLYYASGRKAPSQMAQLARQAYEQLLGKKQRGSNSSDPTSQQRSS